MPGWLHGAGEGRGASWREQLAAHHERMIANRARRLREREAFLRDLAELHRLRWGLPAAVARAHIDAISIVARKPIPDEVMG